MAVQSRPAWISTLMQVILVVCISSPKCVTSSSFVSTPASENGVLTTCVGEQISFTCSHAGEDTSNTRWVFSPPTDCNILIDHENAPDSAQCGPFTIQGISNRTQEMLTSTAVTSVATSLTGTVAECADGTGANAIQFGNTSICVAAQPTNLNVDGSRLSWNGTICSGSSMIYEVTVSGPQTMVFNVTSVTTTPLGDLEPSQMYTVSVRAFGSSCSTQAAGTSFVASGNGGQTTDSSTSSGATTGPPPSSRPSGDSGTAIGLGVTIPLLLIIIAVAVVAAIFVYYFMFYKPNRKPSENLIQDPANHKYAEIKPERKFLSIFKFKKEPEPLTLPAPTPPPPRQSDDSLKVPLEGTSVDPSSDKGSSVDKKETVINIGGHSYHELDDLDQPKSQEGKEVTKKETVVNIAGHSYHELDDLDQPKSQESKEGSSTKQKDTVITVGGHSYHELDDLDEPKSHKGQDKPGSDSAKPSANNKLLSSESAKVEPEDFDPNRRYSEIDKMQKQKDRRKKAAQQDPEAPPLPPAYSPTAVETGGSPAADLGSTDIDQPNAGKPKESTSGSNEEGTKEPASPAQEAPQKPPRTKTNPVSMSERPEKPKRASKAGKDLDTSTSQEPVSASDKKQLNQTTEENGPSQDPPQKPPRSNTNTAPEKPKRVSKIDNSEQRSPSPKPSNT